ncbi:MAG: type B 50S ribosomal protein L31 [Myxococcota bacterium]|nr:type B 50S ribosomal protein L31 [Myxococcota bacterium]
MKEGIHPEYNPVVFIDVSTGDEIQTRSTLTSDESRDIDGVSHYVINCDITSFTHPFYTGKQKLLDAEGRIDRFRKKYAHLSAAKSAPAAEEPAPAEEAVEAAPAEEAAAEEPAPEEADA